MAHAAKKTAATTADLLAIPEGERFHEIIDGELVRKAMPSVLVLSAEGEERVRAEPFDAVTLSVHGLIADDDDDDA